MNGDDLVKKTSDFVQKRKRLFRAYFRTFSSGDGEKILEDLKAHFETNLPCFQGDKGNYDPLDAMRRDACREVILFIEDMASRGRKNNEEEETEEL